MSQVDPSTLSRTQQFVEAWRITRQADPKAAPLTFASFLVGAAVGFLVMWFLPGDGWLSIVLSVVVALLLGVIAALLVFSRRAERAAYSRIEGQTGAAAAALNMLRRGWTVTPAVGFNKNQDLVHRVIGRPGVVLVGEGTSHSRVTALLATEKAKHARVLPETPIVLLVAGNGEDEVPLARLSRTVMKLKRGIPAGEVTEVLFRIKALDAQRGTLPLPKGPVPTSMKGARKAMRGR